MAEGDQLLRAIRSLEEQRAVLGDEVVDAALLPLHERLAAIQSKTLDVSMQRKLVTVLFADVSGFTAMIEHLDPEVVTLTMNALWSRLDGAILAEGGTIDKHIGDAVMALFGAPVGHEDDPEHAVRAALAMQEHLRAFVETENVHSEGRFRDLKMRIGINTGLVLAGLVGTTHEYTAIGDTVNTASRIEHATPIGKVMISQDTYRHVRGIFEVTAMKPISVKGKSEPIQVYLVDGLRPRSFRVTTRGVAGIETPTLGRDREMKVLKDARESALKKAQAVTVVAEAGTGKSRLLYEFTNWLNDQPEPMTVLRGRSSEGMERLPFSLLRDILAFQFEIHEGDQAAAACEKLEKGLLGIMGEEAETTIPFIGHLIGFDYTSDPHLSGILGNARQVRSRAYYYITQLVKKIIANGQLVMFLEDLHWADDDSLSLMEYIITECHDDPLLVVALARPTLFERHPSWGEDASTYARIDLKPLGENDIRALMDVILQRVPMVPESLYDIVLNRADGNPFYVEEVIKMMIEDGIIDSSRDIWKIDAHRLAKLRVPPTLTGVIQARLDGLPVNERKTIQRASVVGRIFWNSVLTYLHEDKAGNGEHIDELPEYLSDLEGKELVFERDDSTFYEAQEYIFKHAILRDVAYESVLMQSRRVYHAQTASWLVERSGERASEFAGRIGEHYERAGESALAANWYVQAGKQARATYATETALEHLRRALALWEKSGIDLKGIAALRIEAYETLGHVLNWLGRFDEAFDAFVHKREEAGNAGDQLAITSSWLDVASTQMYRGDLRSALASAAQGETLARDMGAERELAVSLLLQGWAYFKLGELEMAQPFGEKALAQCKKIDEQEQLAKSLNFLGGVAHMQGRSRDATAYLEEALKIFQALDSRDDVVFLFNNLGVLAEARGDYHTAYGHYESGASMARGIGNRIAEATCISNRGGIAVNLEDYESAITDLKGAIKLMEGRAFSFSSLIYYNLARAYLGLGKTSDAVKAARHSMALSKQFESQDDIARAWRALGQIASAMGKPLSEEQKPAKGVHKYTADECFEKSLDIYSTIGMENERALTLKAWAIHELVSGDREKGVSMWQEARDSFANIDADMEAERMAEPP